MKDRFKASWLLPICLGVLLAGCAGVRDGGARGGDDAVVTAADAAIERVQALADAGDTAGALAAAEQALVAEPDHVELLGVMGAIAAEVGDRDRALDAYRRAAAAAALVADHDAAQFYGDLALQVAEALPDDALARVDAAMGLTEEQESAGAFQDWDVIRNEARALAEEGDIQGAVSVGEQALDLAEETFGPNHFNTLTSLREQSTLAFQAGDASGAESLLLLAMERGAEVLGDTHPEVVAIQTQLAEQYEAAGRLEEADATQGMAMAMAEEALGPDHPLVLKAAMDHARILDSLGDFAAATELLTGTCARIEARLGRFHVRTADCYSQLGVLALREGDLTGTEQALTTAVEIRAAVSGPAAPELLLDRGQLAEAMRRQARFADAERVLDEVLVIAEREHPDDVVLITDLQSYLARLYEDQGRLRDAVELDRAVLAMRRDAYGDDHPATLAAINFVAATELRLGELASAEDGFTQALEGYQALFGQDNAATLAVANNLGVVLEQMGAYDRAEPLLRVALERGEELLGTAHPTSIRAMNNLALLHESQGNFDRAEPYYALPIEVLTAELGADHPDTIAVVNNLAYLYMLKEDWAKAAEMFERAIAAWTATLGPDHQNTLKGRNNLGRSLRGLGRLDEAEAIFEDTLARRREALGDSHIDVQRSMHDLGALYIDLKRSDDAIELLTETLELNERTLGEQHPYTFETLNSLARAREAAGAAAEALELRRIGFERRTAFLDRMLWATSENAREGYVRLHRPELDRYIDRLVALPEDVGGRALLDVTLQRKGLLLQVSSEIQRIGALALDPELTDLTEQLQDARKKLAAITLAGPQGGSDDEHLAQIRELERQVENLQGQIARASGLYRQAIEDIAIEDVVGELPDDGTLVDFFVYEDDAGKQKMAAGIVVKEGGEARFNRVVWDDYPAIVAAVQEYRRIIQDEDAADDEVLEIGMWLYEMLWQPLVDRMPEGGAVYVVPDGILNVLPIEALADPDGMYLLQTTDLHQLSSSRDLLPSELPPAVGPITVLAGPDYDTEAVAGPEVLAEARGRRAVRSAIASGAAPDAIDAEIEDADADVASGSRGGVRASRAAILRGLSLEGVDSRSAAIVASLRAASSTMRGLRFDALPGAEREGELITEQVHGAGIEATMFARSDAQEMILGDFADPPRVLHVATHGFFLKADEELRKRLLKAQRGGAEAIAPPPGDNPLLRAGLAFAGINSNAPFLGEIDTDNDGVLTALEVLSLDLAGTELAVLSACETGLGEIHEGEGVYGLRRAFQEAGVQQIVLSLWEVSDAGTQALMTAMYERLLAGDNPRDALRGAQLQLLEDPQWGYPYVWAAFTVVGS